MQEWIGFAAVAAVCLLAESGIEPRFRLRRRIMRLTVMRHWPERRFWWPGAFLLASGMIALAAALDAMMLPFWPELGDIAAWRYGKIALIVLLFLPRRSDWPARDEPAAGGNAA